MKSAKIIGNKYKIIGRVGEGAFGEVYRGNNDFKYLAINIED